MRSLFLLFSLAVLAGCQGAETDAVPDAPDSAQASTPPPSDSGAEREDPTPDSDATVILFFGDSLTAGYGLPDPDLAYPALVGQAIEAEGVEVEIVNAGVSGETSAGGKGRIAWALRQNTPDVFVLALGANDGLRGTDPAATEANLNAILEMVKEAAPDARLVVAGMEALPNYGAEYVERFRAVFPAVAQRHDAALVPFLLDGVAGEPSLNQRDGVHPTAEGQRIIARTVAQVVVPLASADA